MTKRAYFGRSKGQASGGHPAAEYGPNDADADHDAAADGANDKHYFNAN